MTSNYHPRKLYEDGVQKELFVPAVDILEAKMEIISLSGATDYRVAAKNSSSRDNGRFYVGENAVAKLRERFLEIIGFQKTEPAVFTFHDRSVQIGEKCGDVIWFSFDELCGNKNPLWASDYKKIAKSFSSIFIESIPVFDFYSQNEMQRFIVLIDELYEHKNLLFCSMPFEIDQIYSGKPAVDIKRALSRLSEMSSEKWGLA